MVSVFLKKREEGRILGGHPWVYANEVLRVEGKGGNGEVCAVYNADGRYIGKGFLNHFSKILVRMLTMDGREIDRAFFRERLARAKARRAAYGYTAYRAVFGEADGLPGLVVDVYGDVLCVQVLCLGMEKIKPMLVELLVELFSPRCIYERSDVSVRRKEGLEERTGFLYGDAEMPVIIEENGLKLRVDVVNGQKTGYFLDQKENRKALRKYVAGKTVLDVFSNVGGFALNAAAAGAKEVTAVDVSELAVAEIKANAALNGLNVNAVQADAFELLAKNREEGRKYDVIVLDPPAFCKTADKVPEAIKGYRDVNTRALRLLEEGGILCASSCSQHVSPERFEAMLTEAGKAANCRLRILEKRFQAPDHPILLGSEESAYLKFYVLEKGESYRGGGEK